MEKEKKVMLMAIGRGKGVPSVSPYALKLETYLRLAKINYELSTKKPQGPKGKIPWIIYERTKMGDSHLIIQFLNGKLGVNLNEGKSEELVAIARALRIVLEEHFMSGLIHYRFVESRTGLAGEMKLPALFKIAGPIIKRRAKNRIASGMGQHSQKEIHQMAGDDLRTCSKLLGSKNYFGGVEPCEDDCAIFGFLAQCVWSLPGSIYGKMIDEELVNLKEYCVRMKELVWPDWDEILVK